MYYLNSRYYDAEVGRFISADDINYLDPETIGGVNLYTYSINRPIIYKQDIVLGGHQNTISSCSTYGLNRGNSMEGSTMLEGLQLLVGTIPDIKLTVKYLMAKGIHTKFSYASNTRYIFTVMNGTWRWFKKSILLHANFGTLVKGSFAQILVGDARAGITEILASARGVVCLSVLVNFGFNFYENNLHIDGELLRDTAIDTTIGVSSYYLASGTMTGISAIIAASGGSVPGIVVVGGVVLFSIGFEWLIREVFDYPD